MAVANSWTVQADRAESRAKLTDGWMDAAATAAASSHLNGCLAELSAQAGAVANSGFKRQPTLLDYAALFGHKSSFTWPGDRGSRLSSIEFPFPLVDKSSREELCFVARRQPS